MSRPGWTYWKYLEEGFFLKIQREDYSNNLMSGIVCLSSPAGSMVDALASRQCGPGSIPGVGTEYSPSFSKPIVKPLEIYNVVVISLKCEPTTILIFPFLNMFAIVKKYDGDAW